MAVVALTGTSAVTTSSVGTATTTAPLTGTSAVVTSTVGTPNPLTTLVGTSAAATVSTGWLWPTLNSAPSQSVLMSSKWVPGLNEPSVTVVCYAEIWTKSWTFAGQPPVAPTMLAGPVNIIAGTVSIDRSNAVRRSASNVTIAPDAAGDFLNTAGSNNGYLTPFGNEMRIYRGLKYADGTTEVAQLGIFMIEGVNVQSDSSGTTFIGEMKDLSQVVANHKLTAPLPVPNSFEIANVWGAIISILWSGATIWAGVNGDYNVTPFQPSTLRIGDDPWSAAQSAAASAGMELFYAWSGVCWGRNVPDPTTAPVAATIAAGTPNGPVSILRKISNNGIANVVVVTAQGSKVATPVQVFWWDSNPASPTYYAPAPTSWSSPQYTLPAQAGSYPMQLLNIANQLVSDPVSLQAQANAAGLLSIGALEETTITFRGNPALDVDDVIEVTRVSSGIPASTKYVIDQVQIDLGAKNPMQVTGRLVA